MLCHWVAHSADTLRCTLVVLVSLLILRRPADNEDAAVALSSQNKICDIRSIGSSKQCRRARWRARWRGRCGAAASWSPRGTAWGRFVRYPTTRNYSTFGR